MDNHDQIFLGQPLDNLAGRAGWKADAVRRSGRIKNKIYLGEKKKDGIFTSVAEKKLEKWENIILFTVTCGGV